MARKTVRQEIEARRPVLQMARGDAESRIRAQIDKGKALLGLQIGTEEDLRAAQAQKRKWSDYNAELLRRVVDTDDLVNDYYPRVSLGGWGIDSFPGQVKAFYQEVERYIRRLESIVERLELIPESPGLVSPIVPQPPTSVERGRRVFVVHGRDNEAKESVARCIEKLGMEAVILHERPSRGRTIIEKFEDCADVRFAVVLLTPDDIGAHKDDADNLRPRARQNVVFELGFFIGRLGRERVCALYKGECDIPSDYSGVLWVSMDDGGAWRSKLAQEMKAAGIDLDIDKLFPVDEDAG